MLKALELENFKAFGSRIRIDFARITLIFGKNSAGKSSILQALSLLKQSREVGDARTVLLPRTDRGYVDLGTFQEMIFDHDLGRALKIKLTVASDAAELRHLNLPAFSGVGLEWSVRRPSQSAETHLESLQVFVEGVGDPVATFRVKTNAKDELSDGVGRSLATCVQVSRDPQFWKAAHQVFQAKKYLQTQINRLLGDYLEGLERGKDVLADEDSLESDYHPTVVYLATMISSSIDKDCPPKRREQLHLQHLRQLSDLFENAPWEDAFSRISSYINVGRQIELDGLSPRRVVPDPRTVEGADDNLYANDAIKLWQRIRGDHEVEEELTVDVAKLAVLGAKRIDFCLRKLLPMGPFRRPPQRWYVFSGAEPLNVGYQGQLAADLLFRDPTLLAATNSWLDRLETGYALDVRSVGTVPSDLFSVRLIDSARSSGVSAAIADVGFGISQLLPFIVQSLMGREETISIEQPEVHLHPRLQADIGDLVIRAIGEPHKNQFLIETHSEHLILRILRRIRETTKGSAPEGISITPDDVAVYYVAAEDGRATVRKIDIDMRGEFVQPWPDDFFEIDFHERFG